MTDKLRARLLREIAGPGTKIFDGPPRTQAFFAHQRHEFFGLHLSIFVILHWNLPLTYLVSTFGLLFHSVGQRQRARA